MEKLKTEYNNKINLFEDSIIIFKEKFINFDIDKLILNIEKNIDFEYKFAYSFDKVNWSNPVKKEDWNFEYVDIDDLNNYYISIWCKKINLDTDVANTLYVNQNTENINTNQLLIEKIIYDDIKIEISENTIFINTLNKIVLTDNKWNFYDNQELNVRRWLDTCISVVKSYGHQCIYFKTEVTETHHTFANHKLRNVTAIKKIPIISPDNDLPQDRNVYSEWDMPMEGEFVIHVVDEVFKMAFGETKIPLSKDYLYLPIVRKLFRISSVQPVNGFMGKIGWWEVFLTKYEDDESISISDELKDVYSGIQEFDESFDLIDELEMELDEQLIDNDFITEQTNDEKKTVTNNFSNKLVDSTHYIDLKETELQRQFYSKRLSIASVNPDNNSFPVTMYNCSEIEKRIVALTYNLVDLSSKSKHSLIVDSFEFSTNFVLLNKFTGELYDFVGNNQLSLLTIELNRKKLSLILHKYQITYSIDYEFIENEFYQFLIKYDHSLKQISIMIFMLKNKQKNIVYQNVYIINSTLEGKFEFKNLLLYGGKFLANEIILKVNKEKIIIDNVTPILVMNKMGLQ